MWDNFLLEDQFCWRQSVLQERGDATNFFDKQVSQQIILTF